MCHWGCRLCRVGWLFGSHTTGCYVMPVGMGSQIGRWLGSVKRWWCGEGVGISMAAGLGGRGIVETLDSFVSWVCLKEIEIGNS